MRTCAALAVQITTPAEIGVSVGVCCFMSWTLYPLWYVNIKAACHSLGGVVPLRHGEETHTGRHTKVLSGDGTNRRDERCDRQNGKSKPGAKEGNRSEGYCGEMGEAGRGISGWQIRLRTHAARLRAQKETSASLEKEIRLFFNAPPYTVVVEPDPNEPKHQIHKLRFNGAMPDSFANLTEETVHHLRSALDQIGYGMAVASGNVHPRYTAFPFAGSVDGNQRKRTGRCKDVPEEVRAVFSTYQPYKGGNDFLWALNEVSITDKHKLLSVAVGTLLGNMKGTGGI